MKFAHVISCTCVTTFLGAEAASTEYIAFLKQQQDLQTCHKKLEDTIGVFSAFTDSLGCGKPFQRDSFVDLSLTLQASSRGSGETIKQNSTKFEARHQRFWLRWKRVCFPRLLVDFNNTGRIAV